MNEFSSALTEAGCQNDGAFVKLALPLHLIVLFVVNCNVFLQMMIVVGPTLLFHRKHR